MLLLEHGSDGSLGVVLNQPTERSVDDALDVRAGTSGIDLHVSWGGPVQPGAVLSLVRTLRPGPRARTILAVWSIRVRDARAPPAAEHCALTPRGDDHTVPAKPTKRKG